MTRNYAISLPQHPPGPPSITQPSNSTDTAVSALQNPINSPPQILRRQLTATALRHTSAIILPNYHQRPLSFFLTKLKATFHLGLEPTLLAKLPPSDQRANHSATLTPRKFRLLDFYLHSTSVSGA